MSLLLLLTTSCMWEVFWFNKDKGAEMKMNKPGCFPPRPNDYLVIICNQQKYMIENVHCCF